MTAPFIHRPGVFGEQLIRPPTNLADADTAHMVQGIGLWVPQIDSEGLAVLPDPSAPFGDSSLRWQAIGANEWNVVGPVGFPIQPSTTYTGSVWVKSPIAVAATFRIHDDIGSAPGDVIDLVPDTWTQLTSTHLTAATATVLNPWLSMNWNEIAAPDAVQYQASAYTLREGAGLYDFIPSLGITGSLDLRWDAIMLPWADTDFATVLSTRVAPLMGYTLAIHPGPAVQVFYSDGTDERSHEQPIAVTPGQRHQIRATFDQPAGTWRFYVDAIQQGADVTGFGTGPGIQADSHLSVGANPAGASSRASDMFTASAHDGIDGPAVYQYDAGDVLGGITP